jgi:hypothetical protein
VTQLHERKSISSASDKPGQNAPCETIIRVRFFGKASRGWSTPLWTRQFPGDSTVWGRCRFEFEDSGDDYDWLVVYDDFARTTHSWLSAGERLRCHPSCTILVTAEPSSIKLYGRDFLSQFGVVLTSQEPRFLSHPGAVYSQPGLRWYYGIGSRAIRRYDEIARARPAKSGEISTVCSEKRQTHTCHARRYDFIQQLRTLVPEMEVFGHGVRDIDDKADAVDPWRYHVAIENHVAPHHWTEKLADAYLGWSLPLYYGCPNVSDYFPADSYVPIDIDDPKGTAVLIRRIISNGEYEKRVHAIAEARRLVLDQYNLFAVLSRLIEERHSTPVRPAPHLRALHSRHSLRVRRPMTLIRDIWDWVSVRG